MRTFGIEIEFFTTMPWYDRNNFQITNTENLSIYKQEFEILEHLKKNVKNDHPDIKKNWFDNWRLKTDGSVSGDGRELISPPLQFNAAGLYQVCEVLRALKQIAFVDKTCGLHVHVGVSDLKYEQFFNALLLWAVFKEETNAFLPPHRRENRFCKHLDSNLLRNLSEKENFGDIPANFGRYFHTNPMAYAKYKTLEFRGLEGTLDQDVVCTWIAIVVGFIEKIAKQPKKICLQETGEDIVSFQKQKKILEFENVTKQFLDETEFLINQTQQEENKKIFSILKDCLLFKETIEIPMEFLKKESCTYLQSNIRVFYNIDKNILKIKNNVQDTLNNTPNIKLSQLSRLFADSIRTYQYLLQLLLKQEITKTIGIEAYAGFFRKYEKYTEGFDTHYDFFLLFSSTNLNLFKTKNPDLNPLLFLDEKATKTVQERKEMFTQKSPL